MKKYNVIIAGAGLAGLSLAKELAGSGLSVLVLDKKKKAGDVPYYSSGSFMEPSCYGIPAEAVNKINEVVFSSKNLKCAKKVRDCYVIDRQKLYSWMESVIVKDKNIKIRYCCEIKSSGNGRRNISCINYSDRGREVGASADIYADCTGLNAVLGRKSGLTPRKCVMALGVEYLVPLKNHPGTVFFYTGGNTGGGYGWLFPRNSGQAIAGVGVIREELYPKIDSIFNKMWEKRGMSFICKRRVINKNFASLRTGAPLKSFVKGNLIIAGDSAMQANPLIGEGIRFILDGTREAGTCIKESVRQGSIKPLKKYGKEWRAKYLEKFRFAYALQRLLREVTMHDWILDKGVKVLNCCSEGEFRRVLSADISLGFLLKIVVKAWWRIKVKKEKF